MHILLVEDSPDVSCITVEYLHELGHQVVAVTAAEQAIAQLKDSANAAFDAVMTDVRLPGMSGIELAQKLVKDHPNIPVVIASGYGALNVKFLLGQNFPSVLVLPKPYDLETLEQTLSAAAAFKSRA